MKVDETKENWKGGWLLQYLRLYENNVVYIISDISRKMWPTILLRLTNLRKSQISINYYDWCRILLLNLFVFAASESFRILLLNLFVFVASESFRQICIWMFGP